MEVTNDSIPLIIKDLSALPNLQSLSLSFSETASNDFLLYGALSSISYLRELKCGLCETTMQGVLNLSESITNSKLQHLSINAYHHDLRSELLLFNFPKVIESALTCPTLERLSIYMPLQSFSRKVSNSIEHIVFNSDVSMESSMLTKFCDWLVCIADLCKVSSLKSSTNFLGNQSSPAIIGIL